MQIRTPSGRAGRPWLVRRLETARRGADVLDQKRQALLRLERRLSSGADEAASRWEDAAQEADAWLRRARMVGGERAFELACFYSGGPVRATVQWRRSLGVSYPAEAEIEAPPPPDLSALGGGTALVFAAGAHRRAIQAAVEHGAAMLALNRVRRELRSTTRRLRAVERRWIPAHESALAALVLALDESERQESARVRWFIRRQRR